MFDGSKLQLRKWKNSSRLLPSALSQQSKALPKRHIKQLFITQMGRLKTLTLPLFHTEFLHLFCIIFIVLSILLYIVGNNVFLKVQSETFFISTGGAVFKISYKDTFLKSTRVYFCVFCINIVDRNTYKHEIDYLCLMLVLIHLSIMLIIGDLKIELSFLLENVGQY